MTLRTRTVCVAIALVAALYTLLVSVLPYTQYAYQSAPMHVAIETAAALVGFLAAFLLLGRYRRSARLSDLLLVIALGILSVTSLCFSVIPAVIDDTPGAFASWAPAFGGLLGAWVLAAAAVSPDTRLHRPSRELLRAGIASAGVLALLALLVALLGHNLPEVIDPTLSPDASDHPRIVGDPTVLGVQLLSTLFFAVAAVGFVRRSERTHDELTSWLALAATMGAFARLNYFLFPSLYSQWIYTGDALRLAFFVLLIVGALREIGAYQRQLASVAVFDERRRMARDLHDGLAQELAYISAQSRRMLERGDAEPGIHRVAAAAQRALDESRVAITALTAPLDEPLDSVLVRTAEELAGRAGASVSFDIDEHVQASGPEREALLRIVRESVTNAVRHGHATRLTVTLEENGGLRLSVSDNGEGFDPSAGRNGGGGFGLVSMSERAEALGGELHVSSRPGHGTHVEVVLP